jgi:hypothetical protein
VPSIPSSIKLKYPTLPAFGHTPAAAYCSRQLPGYRPWGTSRRSLCTAPSTRSPRSCAAGPGFRWRACGDDVQRVRSDRRPRDSATARPRSPSAPSPTHDVWRCTVPACRSRLLRRAWRRPNRHRAHRGFASDEDAAAVAGVKHFHHRLVGHLELAYESVDMISDLGLTLTITPPNSTHPPAEPSTSSAPGPPPKSSAQPTACHQGEPSGATTNAHRGSRPDGPLVRGLGDRVALVPFLRRLVSVLSDLDAEREPGAGVVDRHRQRSAGARVTGRSPRDGSS